MEPFVERFHAVKDEARGATPYDDIAMFKPYPPWPIVASEAAEQKDRRQPERDGDNRRIEIKLVPILMQ